MCFEKQQRIRKELEKFYHEKINQYRNTNNDYEADKLVSAEIYTKLKEEKER